MKIDPLEVLLNKNLKINKKLFLISGNETTLMEKIKETYLYIGLFHILNR